MASRTSPSTIVHPNGLKKRCASNRRYAVAYVSSYVLKWNKAKQDYDRFDEAQEELVIERRTDSLTTAYDVYNKHLGLKPVIWDLSRGVLVCKTMI